MTKLVVWTLAATAMGACGARFDPKGPADGEEAATGPVAGPAAPPAPAVARGVRDVMLGEMCPSAAAERPAVLPLFVHAIGWKHDEEDVAMPLERHSARQFSVLGWDGGRVGVFSVAGLAQTDQGPAAIGAYAGSSPCAKGQRAGGQAELYGECVAAQRHCGLAVARLEPTGQTARPLGEDPEPMELTTGRACVAKDLLLVDLDEDGVPEAFPVQSFLGGMRSPAEEVLAVSAKKVECEGSFSVRHAIPPGDPRDWLGMDILGIVDLDSDGRHEVIAVYHYAGKRTWALYSPINSAARLELIGETLPWSVR